MIKVTFVSMWHSIVPASASLLYDELVALSQREDEIEFWFHGCHLPTSQWFLNQIIKLKACARAEIKIVDVVDPLVNDELFRETAEQLQYEKFDVDEDVCIQYAPELNSKPKYGSKHFIARSNQVNRWMIDQCDYLIAYYYKGIPNAATPYVRRGLRNPNVTVISVVDCNTVSQIEKLIGEMEGRTREIIDGIRDGRTYKSIGDELHISSNRVLQLAYRASRKIMYAIDQQYEKHSEA